MSLLKKKRATRVSPDVALIEDLDVIYAKLRGLTLRFFLRGKIPFLRYGTMSIIALSWITDWKAVCKHIPFYGGKYEREDSRR
ncbi:hypothetical protein PUN28_013648 [Cardiocondyla obscurior]|uniref:Uncharacterized protein n=1 Tax=Cardiocondyla obscurior TaxID=286306 RepID=A0AAW2F6N7_9HYME